MTNHLERKFTHPAYRADIDGLRAIAVLAVIGFHFFPSLLKGGFVGVDIFFVISGYLISTIVFENSSKNTFTFREFYSRRILRIFPALLIVLIVSLIIGWLLLLADEYQQLGKHVAAGSLFINNFILLGESGYFDNAANTKPLLHLWSLSIEEQFYIFWPLLLWFLWRKQAQIFWAILFVLGTSFLFNINGIQKDIITTFYSPQTRFWELAAGSFLAWITFCRLSFPKDDLERYAILSSLHHKIWSVKSSQLSSQLVSISGILLILYSIFLIHGESRFPGWWALMPVSGTLLIILAGPNTWANKAILGNKYIVWVGLISYPLYLWHWPLYAFARVTQGEIPTLEVRILIIAVTILLAWLTYKFVERPIRFSHQSFIALLLICIMFCTGIVGYFIFIKEGVPSRLRHQSVLTYVDSLKFSDRKKECFDIHHAYKIPDNWFCKIGVSPNKADLFVFGDSHAASMLPAIESLAKNKEINILFAGTSGCPPLLEIQSERGDAEIEKYNCQSLNERIFDYVKRNNISSVLLVGRWIYYTGNDLFPDAINHISTSGQSERALESSRIAFNHGLRTTIERYNAIGVKVFIAMDNPQQRSPLIDALRVAGITGDSETKLNKSSITLQEHQLTQDWVNKAIAGLGSKNVQIINFDGTLCNDGICPLAKENQSIYYDTHHLTVYGSQLVVPVLQKYLMPTAPK